MLRKKRIRKLRRLSISEKKDIKVSDREATMSERISKQKALKQALIMECLPLMFQSLNQRKRLR